MRFQCTHTSFISEFYTVRKARDEFGSGLDWGAALELSYITAGKTFETHVNTMKGF